MDTQLLVSTALVTTQINRQPQSTASGREGVSKSPAAAPVAPGDTPETQAMVDTAAGKPGGNAVLQQSAPNSALTTYRDQDSGRLIVRVYDRESGDVLVEFPPERAFRPAGVAVSAPSAKPKTNISA